MIIRPMARGDAETVHEIHGACLPRTLLGRYTHEQVTAWLDGRAPDGYIRASEAGERFFVAEADGVVVGYAPWEEDVLLSLFVHPDCQSRGIGSALMRPVWPMQKALVSLSPRSSRYWERRHSTPSMALRRCVGEAQRSEASRSRIRGCVGRRRAHPYILRSLQEPNHSNPRSLAIARLPDATGRSTLGGTCYRMPVGGSPHGLSD